MDSSELKGKVIKGIIYNFSGSLLKNGITFIISIFLSRILSPTDFGLVGMATVFITFAQGLSDLGLSSGLIKEENPTASEMSSVFFFNMGIAILLTVILFFSSGVIAAFYERPEMELIIKIISFTFILNSLNTVHQAILYKNLEIKITRISGIISAIITGVVGISLANLGFGVWSLIYSTYAGGIVSVIIIWKYSKWRPMLVFCVEDIKKLMPFGIKVFLVNYLEQIYSRIDVMIIGKIFNPAILGYYFRASSLNQLITKYSSQGLSGIFFPAISKLQGNIPQIIVAYKKSLHAICFLSFFITGLLYVNASPMIVFLFSEKWLPSVEYFKILAFGSYAFPLTIIFNGVLLGTGNSGSQLKLEFIKKGFGIAGLAVGFFFGMKGYLWSMAVTASINLILSFFYLKKILGLSILNNCKAVFSYTIPLLLSSIIVILFENYNTITSTFAILLINSVAYTSIYLYTSHKINLLGYSTIYTIVLGAIKKKNCF